MKKRGLIVAFGVLLIVIGIAAHRFGWIKPLNPATFMHFEPGSYAVKKFVDGDTIIVDMNGTEETVRFIGVDTPETHKPNTPVQCYGPDAAAYTKQRIGNTKVRLVSDSLTTDRDRYNRLLRYVVLEDGTYLNQELINKGYAFAYAFPFANLRKYANTMEDARNAHRGLWASCKPMQDPTTGQWHSNDVSTDGV